jgi:streptomycin 6-kinase
VKTSFEQRIVEVYGARGEAWLASLPARVAACEVRWGIAVEGPFADLTHNWVASAIARDGAGVVLKLGLPTAELDAEIRALRAWDGHGAARLIEGDGVEGALLTERLSPGRRLADFGLQRDDAATDIAAELMRQLHATPPVSGLSTLDEWTSGITRASNVGFAPSLIDLAVRLRGDLLASAPEPVLLHGDLHHFNILSADRQPWLAIDPKGVVGDPAYEPAPFLYNPIDRILSAPDAAQLVARRIDRFAQQFARQRVVDWALVQSVLSAWWSFEDHGHGHEPALHFAELLARLRQI